MEMEYLWAMKEFRNDDIEVRVILENKAYCSLSEITSNSGRFETGGILIGYYDVLRQNAIVTEITNAPKDSKSGGTWFLRGVSGLKQLLIHRWKIKEEYYLGEWHFHPKSSPKPSFVDISQMKQISKDNRYNCKEPLLLIVGENKGKLAINIMLIINNKIYELREKNS